ncbi:MAG: bifunctional phosphoglucose/phosphomannose isomerase [Candidatus Krumholzibacteriota bacterium]|nr:bifunctional phosphoglucose/phosphomannose isomerase [Candidatus Krumholzibacteriota bacterium]
MNIKDRFNKYDRSGMLENILSLPDHIREAWKMSGDFILPRPSGPNPLVICGMGGSAIGAFLIRDLIKRECDFPVQVERGYLLPPHVGSDATVICISYSGNTEEVLKLFGDAAERGCNTGVITSGGELAGEAAKRNVSMMKVREGLPPRAAIGLLFTTLLHLMVNWGVYEITGEELNLLTERIELVIKKLTPESNARDNPAFELSKKLCDKMPVIYAGDGLLEGISYRWKCQFNENSKIAAYSNIFPELVHNEVMGWECSEEIMKNLFFIFLTDSDDHPGVRKRMDAAYSMLAKSTGEAVMIGSSWYGNDSPGRLERLLSMLALGDFISLYLAVGRGVDPTPVGKIEKIKKFLKIGEL